MNLFILDLMPVTAAHYNCDKHVVKIILEAVGMMGYAYDQGDFYPLPWLKKKGPHYFHPMSKWVRETKQNFDWAFQHTEGLLNEFTFRYGHEHSYQPHIKWIGNNFPLANLPAYGMTDWPRCFGDWKEKVGVSEDIVYDYRRYYMVAKRDIVKWTKRPIPEWYR